MLASRLLTRRALPRCAQTAVSCRSFSGEASAVPLRGPSGNVTRIIFQSAQEHGELDLLREELRDVHHLFKKDANFRRMINQGRSEELPASDFTKVLLDELKNKKQLKNLVQVCKDFEKLMIAHNQEVHATVTVAAALSDKEQNELKKTLANTLAKGGKKIILSVTVDPSISGGMVLTTQDGILDLSLKTMIDKWASAIEQSSAAEFDGKLIQIQDELDARKYAPGNDDFLKRVKEGQAALVKSSGYQ